MAHVAERTMSAANVSAPRRVALWVASLGGVGYCPIASGTAASAVSGAVIWLLPAPLMTQLIVLAVVVIVGLWSSDMACAATGIKDPSCVVIDELAGMLIACLMVRHTPGRIVAAFVLFRIFDIGKWFPMKQLERLPGGWGVMMDDLAAGVLARACLLPWT